MSVVQTTVDGPLGRITLNRPERMNSITVELAAELADALRRLGRSDDVNVIVVRGSGGNFCAGGDFDEVERLRAEGPEALGALFTTFRAACDTIAEVAVPVVAAVEGVAAAGGFEFLQAADIVLVSDAARIADNHIRFGMIPGGGSTARLPRILGRQQAMGLLLSGDRLSGRDAVELGLAYRSFPPETFDADVEAFLGALAGRSRRSTTTIKRLVDSGLQETLGQALSNETDAVVRHIIGDGADAAAAFGAREART
ncbi:enoyl-CoA hydratase/isomerase family protein [Mycolicibacterium sp.]|uniref:enoyl-CoA hydratase/isomerase family protein n=1 Tax=Mycolicibacterium sp. TaxID=2320850 RepID=UPI003D09D737